jgi:hypothetical protein
VRGNPLLYWDEDGRDGKQFVAGIGDGFKEMGVEFVEGQVANVQTALTLASNVVTAMREHRVLDAAAAMSALNEYLPSLIPNPLDAAKYAFEITRGFGEAVLDAVDAPDDYTAGKISSKILLRTFQIAQLVAEGMEMAEPRAPSADPKCGGGNCTGRKCFVRGTLVATATGLKPIEDILEGDFVLSKDEWTGETAYQRVEKTFQRRTQALEALDLVCADGTSEHLITTEEHPFFIEGRGWVNAGTLVVGDRLVGSDGRALTVASAALRAEEADVWNFRVDGFHSYFVGEHGAWVHNAPSSYDSGGGAKEPKKASSPGKMQQEVRKGQAPREIVRVDPAHTKPGVPNQEPHVHYEDGTSSNQSGTTHDKLGGEPKPSKAARKWLESHGWTPPPKPE